MQNGTKTPHGAVSVLLPWPGRRRLGAQTLYRNRCTIDYPLPDGIEIKEQKEG